MRRFGRRIGLAVACVAAVALESGAQTRAIMTAGKPGRLDIRPAGERAIRITLAPLAFGDSFPYSPGVAERSYPTAAIRLRELTNPVTRTIAGLTVTVRPDPLTVTVLTASRQPVQRIVFDTLGRLSFDLDAAPVLGMGEGGPRPRAGSNFRTQAVQFDRRGALDTMEPRWQSDMYGSRNPVATLVGTSGWGLFVPTPWGQVDLRDSTRGYVIPWVPPPTMTGPQNQRNQQQAAGKGLPPASAVVPGVFDVFVFDAHDPTVFLRDYSVVTGPAVLPPRWALGYMQSHRTLEDEKQILAVVDSFRSKKIPVDAVIYLGTGFSPRGWNTTQPSFNFNPIVFPRGGDTGIADLHARNVKVVVHMVPWDRDRLPTLHGTIPAKPGQTLDVSHIQNYWAQHVGLVKSGVDAFWPDEGDWFDLWERITRHRMYYEGSLSTTPNVRPWALHRNGYPGIAQWGGWVWSGDTETSWKTLEGQIAVGINYSLSVSPYWGSDIGGFYPNSEFTGELYARWFQFAAFCGSFRSHGRTWWVRLPWGWGQNERGPLERNNTNTNNPTDPNDRNAVLQSEMNNPAIEPVARQYSELRYQLMPYTYTLAYEARASGLPLMRAMWVHAPDDPNARDLHTQYTWGRDLLIAPVFEKGATSRSVYLPKGDWYDWFTNTRHAGGTTVTRAVDLSIMPMYVRAGAIIPFDPVRQYTSQPVAEPTTLKVYRGANGEFTFYDDDGVSQEYLQNRGSWIGMRWDDGARRLTLAPAPPRGSTNVVRNREFVVTLLPEGTTRRVSYTGRSINVTF
jgi:alpha-glucosidase (family GH31 glycosyl hydrolase)